MKDFNKNDRRGFLKHSGLAGLGIVLGSLSVRGNPITGSDATNSIASKSFQRFNMSGYAAPPMKKVRVGFIGLGNRGPTHLKNVSYMEGVEIKALCDARAERTEAAKNMLKGTNHNPELYDGNEDIWKEMCRRDDLDLIYIATPWDTHTPMAVYAMEQGKHVAIEVPAATSLEECWQLVDTSERTKKHCVILENCCYDFFELLTLNMARKGFFGDIIHGEGAYIHSLAENIFSKTKNYKNYRLRENTKHNGNLYPTHGLGPICQIMNINRGDRMDYMTSMSSDDFMMGKMAEQLAESDPFYDAFTGQKYRGNMNTSVIKTHKGRTIMLQHDVTSPRVYSRIHLVSGTKGMARKYPLPGKIALGHEGWLSEEKMKELEEKYSPDIVKLVGKSAKEVGGHGGMDFLMDWRLIDCIRNGHAVDMDVYDAASWSCIFPLSEWSVKNRSSSIDVPDFTRGSWISNAPVDLALKNGVTTNFTITGKP